MFFTFPHWDAYVDVIFYVFYVFYVFSVVYVFCVSFFSDWTLVHRHPCGVPLANAVWVIEQLHPFPVLFSLLEEITSLAEFLQFLEVEKIPSSPINESRDDVVIECRSSVTGRIRLNSMENVCTVFELYRNREKTRKQ